MATRFLMLVNSIYEEKSKQKKEEEGEDLAEEINERKAR